MSDQKKKAAPRKKTAGKRGAKKKAATRKPSAAVAGPEVEADVKAGGRLLKLAESNPPAQDLRGRLDRLEAVLHLAGVFDLK